MTTRADRGLAAIAVGLTFGAMALAAPLAAQDVDLRWLPYLGCWEPVGQGAEGDLVCVRPADEQGGVEIVTLSGTAVVSRELIRADGRSHEATREACKGREEAAFSQDGRRILLNSTFTCEGDVTHVGSGILAMAGPSEWLDIRTAGTPGRHVAWVQRYVPADPALAEAAGFGAVTDERSWTTRTARITASQPLTVDDVIEASARVPAEAVQALVAERGHGFDLSAADLIRMADSGVADEVIDVTVAVSFPERFQLNAQGAQMVTATALDRGSLRRRWTPGLASAWYDPFYSSWGARYGYFGYGYGYSPYGYGYSPYFGWGGYGGYGYGGYGGYAPVVIEVDRVAPDHGRVIAGRGYSRGSSGGSSGGTSGGQAAGPSRSSGSSGSTGSAGSASGGSSGGRTAKPRGSG